MRHLGTFSGFKALLKVLEPRYTDASCNHILSHNSDQGKKELTKGVRHAITTDGWTSMTKDSFITITCHYIDPNTFKLCSIVLNTNHCPASHTDENLSNELHQTVETWLLNDPVRVTDNASNICKTC